MDELNYGLNLIQTRRNNPTRPDESVQQEYDISNNGIFFDTPVLDDDDIPYNIPSRRRPAELNPGGINSFYDIYGVYAFDPSMRRIINPDGTLHNPAYEIEPADEVIPIQNNFRRVTRSSQPQTFVPDHDCVSQTDPITEKKIVNGFRLEVDGRCYDATTISDIRDSKSPFTREPFTAKDISRRTLFNETRGGSKRHSKRPKRPKRHSKRPKRPKRH
jgi:hypothetical protein